MTTKNEKIISSSSNEKFKIWSSLLDSRGIKKHGLFLLSGEKVIREILTQAPDKVSSLLVSEKQLSRNNLAKLFKASINGNEVLAAHLFKELDIFGTDMPLAVCKCPAIEEWRPDKPSEGLTILCPLGDPANLGGVIRTAAAFDVKNLVLLKEAANPFHPRAIRAASGSIFSLKIEKGPSIHELNGLKLHSLIALDANGDSLKNFQWPPQPLLLIGEEGPGVPSQLNGKKISIPMSNQVESLNATIAAAVAISHFVFSRH